MQGQTLGPKKNSASPIHSACPLPLNITKKKHNAGLPTRTVHFMDNSHIALPAKCDLEPVPQVSHTAFPIPLPCSTPLPEAILPMPDAKVSLMGQFGLSAPDVLGAPPVRRCGPPHEALVRGVEDELVRWLCGKRMSWLCATQAQLSWPDGLFQFPGRAVAGLRTSARSSVTCHSLCGGSRMIHGCSMLYTNCAVPPLMRYLSGMDTPTHHVMHILRPNMTDRKSTRLNSSHLVISYAVFCLKKKKKKKRYTVKKKKKKIKDNNRII